jgi:hypothetical protein
MRRPIYFAIHALVVIGGEGPLHIALKGARGKDSTVNGRVGATGLSLIGISHSRSRRFPTPTLTIICSLFMRLKNRSGIQGVVAAAVTTCRKWMM